ncbi:hypothetical protein [Floccifex sp.]|uniref:hypothetical protein n=1 Tax=Floccifex sp. TaxID=2815810 RepID=UPI002A757FB6|nr:hypothetical protein [Floccifex sp.]MDD7282205.1 hypothetical protein [Erysipelotrichaceae bacterium]MDY2958434.1 hypothetical protein [Floccifex sp.]
MAKWTQEQYAAKIQEKKVEAHNKQWLYIELNAGELKEECEPGVSNMSPCCKAMVDAMLEGDGYIVEPKIRTKVAKSLTVRYYVDNLSPSRRKYSDVVNG